MNASARIVSRTDSALVLRPSVQASQATLRQWLVDHVEIRYVVAYGEDDVVHLRPMLGTQRVHVIQDVRSSLGSNPIFAVWCNFTSMFRRCATVLVLCVDDAEAMMGQTVYRIVAEALWADRIVLLGPNVVTQWPGGWSLFTPRRARELVPILASVAVGATTATIVLVAIAFQEAFRRVRVRQ